MYRGRILSYNFIGITWPTEFSELDPSEVDDLTVPENAGEYIASWLHREPDQKPSHHKVCIRRALGVLAKVYEVKL